MSTRGNYIFTTIPKVKVDGEWLTDVDAIKNLAVEISNDDEIVKNGYKVYVHSDNYPSYALPNQKQEVMTQVTYQLGLLLIMLQIIY